MCDKEKEFEEDIIRSKVIANVVGAALGFSKDYIEKSFAKAVKNTRKMFEEEEEKLSDDKLFTKKTTEKEMIEEIKFNNNKNRPGKLGIVISGKLDSDYKPTIKVKINNAKKSEVMSLLGSIITETVEGAKLDEREMEEFLDLLKDFLATKRNNNDE